MTPFAMRMSRSTLGLLLTMTTASAAEPLVICLQAEINLPTLEGQRNYLAHNPRYGSDLADEYFDVAKQYGDDFIQYQVHYQPGASGSLRNDVDDLCEEIRCEMESGVDGHPCIDLASKLRAR